MSSVTITLIVIALSCQIITVITLCQIENKMEHIEQMLLDAKEKIKELYREQ